jgi:uncharacterized protein (TIGR02246 family)
MRTKVLFLIAVSLSTAQPLDAQSAPENPPAKKDVPTGEKGREADVEAIRASSREFVQAFGMGDARAVAALWTEQGEFHDDSGNPVRGRAAIEEAFRAFFKENPNRKIEVLIESIRFPARDLAIEMGVLRQSGADKELPATTLYTVIHVRERGQWKMAVSREWGAGQDRLEDLHWLIGRWKATLTDQETTLVFSRDEGKPFITGQFTKKSGDKIVSSGTMRIGFDTQRGRLRSWHFDDDGGHGQALWIRDGNRWVLDAIGIQGNGVDTAALNILGRLNHDEFTWRSIDRVIGNQAQPDTVPIRLKRVMDSK